MSNLDKRVRNMNDTTVSLALMMKELQDEIRQDRENARKESAATMKHLEELQENARKESAATVQNLEKLQENTVRAFETLFSRVSDI